MPQMRVALRAEHLGAAHSVSAIDARLHVRIVHRRPETGPTGAGIELGAGAEQFVIAADAAIGAVVVQVPVFAGEGGLGAALARDLILLRGQLPLPDLI